MCANTLSSGVSPARASIEEENDVGVRDRGFSVCAAYGPRRLSARRLVEARGIDHA